MTKTKKRFIASADWHYGKRKYGLKHMEKDRYEAGDQVVEHAVSTPGTSFMIGAGDLLDVTRPSSAAVVALQKIHRRLEAAGIPFFVVQGNHDKSDPPWYTLFEGEGDDKKGIVLLQDGVPIEHEGLTILGFSELGREDLKAKLKKAKPADILILHASVQEWIGFPNPNAVCLADDVPPGKFRYVIVGDTHVTARIDGPTVFLSPGSIETGDRGEPRDKWFQSIALDDFTDTVDHPIKTRRVVDLFVREEADREAALKEFEDLDKEGALVYLYYNPEIKGLLDLFLKAKRNPQTYLDPKCLERDAKGVMSDASEEDGEDGEEEEEERTLVSFTGEFTKDEVVLAAARSAIETENSMQDIVESIIRETTTEKDDG